jgi:general secretion pathway protein N
MRRRAALMLGIGSYLLFLLLYFPAQQAMGLASVMGLELPFRLDGTQGTLWSGEAGSLSYQGMPLGRISWHFKPAGLLLGRIGYQIELRDAGQEITGSVRTGLGGGYRMEELTGLLEAERIPQLMGQGQIGMGGRLDLNQLDLAFDDGRISAAEKSIRWHDASLTSPVKVKLGDLQADLSNAEDGGVKAEIHDLSGPTGIKANANLAADGNFQFEGSVKPSSGSDPGLTTALQAFGASRPDGSFPVKYSGRF